MPPKSGKGKKPSSKKTRKGAKKGGDKRKKKRIGVDIESYAAPAPRAFAERFGRARARRGFHSPPSPFGGVWPTHSHTAPWSASAQL